ncbi:MAG: virulence factor, partial [Pseudomonadota bacterium]
MPQLVTVFWRDIPAQVIIRKGRKALAKRQLPERFEQA